jgi:phi LC3 family holin
MKINWKARFKNKAFVITFVTIMVSLVYQILGLFGVVPSISETDIVNVFTLIVNALAALGILVDPTTKGMSDSERALTYYTENDERVNK